MIKLKHLIRKFGYRSIIKECGKQGWDLPYSTDLIGQDLEYDIVWVKDMPKLREDITTHGMIYEHSTGKTYLCNKKFMQHIVVIKQKGNQ